jgi:hypothetical protein
MTVAEVADSSLRYFGEILFGWSGIYEDGPLIRMLLPVFTTGLIPPLFF